MISIESSAPRVAVSLSVMTGVAFIFMVIRFSCKLRYNKLFGLDDHMLTASWICLAAYAALIIISTNYGIGLHISLISDVDLVRALRLLYVARFIAVIALSISKTSFAVTLLHIVSIPWQRHALWFVITSLNVMMWVSALSLFLQCSPIEKAWDLNVNGACWSPMVQVNIGISAGAYSAAMDFCLALFPTLLFGSLKIKRSEKYAMILAMSLGMFAGITAVVKTYFISGSQRSKDFTFTSANLLIWSGAETAVTIIATSLPFMRLLVKELRGLSSKVVYPKDRGVDLYYREDVAGNRPGRQNNKDSDKSIDSGTKRGQLRVGTGQATVNYSYNK